MISNIYLVIIIMLIGLIIFLIFQSHEYTNIEGFEAPTISFPNDISDSLKNDYKNFNTQIRNKIIDSNNLNNATLKKLFEKNKEKAKQLLADTRTVKDFISTNYPVNEPIKTIKSKYNSQVLSTNLISSTDNQYNVLANNKCITVAGLCPGDFCTQDCQNVIYSSDSQKFKTNRVNNKYEAARLMNIDHAFVNDDNVYPFNIFQSLVNNKCLTSANGGITVDKCDINNIKQQWLISPTENQCVLE